MVNEHGTDGCGAGEGPQRPRQTMWIVVGVAGAIVVVTVLCRWLLFARGDLYGTAATHAANLLVAAITVMAAILAVRLVRGRGAGGDGREGTVVVVAGTLGLATAAYSAVALAFPNTPIQASVAACDGVPVYGSRFLAQTREGGVSARGGAGRQYQQVNHYPGNCTLGFDGMCIGEPWPDRVLADAPDQRWLRVHNRHEYIPSGAVNSQNAEFRAGTRTEPDCAAYGGRPRPERLVALRVEPEGDAGGPERTRLTATAKGAQYVGYAVADTRAGATPYRQLGRGADAQAGFPVEWPPAPGPVLSPGPFAGRVVVAGFVCWAGNAPDRGTGLAVGARVDRRGGLHATGRVALPGVLRGHLAEMACARTP